MGFPRFHIYKCETILNMQSKKKGYRYKVSTRSDGEFYLKKSKRDFYEHLEICSYCLKKYNHKFSSNDDKQTFPLANFIKASISNPDLKGTEIDLCTVPSEYTKSWKKISSTRREQVNYKCQKCKIDCSSKERKKYLHVHHIDANKINNAPENLKVLCIKCHAEEHNHGHLKQHRHYKEFIKLIEDKD